MKVEVYFNLHKQCYSIRFDRSTLWGTTGSALKGRVIAHAQRVELKDVTCRVSQAGRQRVRETQRKNVHAFMIGTLVGLDGMRPTKLIQEYHKAPPPLYYVQKDILSQLEATERRGVTCVLDQPASRVRQVYYSPYTCETFEYQDCVGEAFTAADAMVLQSDRKLFALDRRPDMARQARYTCNKCGSDEVEVLMPAWYAANSEYEMPEQDSEASPLSTWCLKCEDHITLWDNHEDRTISGRW